MRCVDIYLDYRLELWREDEGRCFNLFVFVCVYVCVCDFFKIIKGKLRMFDVRDATDETVLLGIKQREYSSASEMETPQ